MISCAAGELEELGVDCAHNDCNAIIKKQRARAEYFICNLFGLLKIVCSCTNDFIVRPVFSRSTISTSDQLPPHYLDPRTGSAVSDLFTLQRCC